MKKKEEENSEPNNFKPMLLAIIAVLAFSTKAVFAKIAYDKYDVSYISILALRMGFSLPFFILIEKIFRKKEDNKLKSKQYFFIILLGILGYYLSSLFDFIGLTYISASLERLLLFVYPTLVLIFNKLIFKKKINKGQMIALIFAYIGLIVIFTEAKIYLIADNSYLIGSAFVLLSATTYALYLVGNQYILKSVGAIKFNSIAQMTSCICVLIHASLVINVEEFNYPPEVYGLGFGMAIISTLIPSYLLSLAIQQMGASNVAICGVLGPISTIGLSIIILGDSLSLHQSIGGGIVVLGVLGLQLQKNKRHLDLEPSLRKN